MPTNCSCSLGTLVRPRCKEEEYCPVRVWTVLNWLKIDLSDSRQIHIECQSKHNYICVIYKVLVYVQTSQPPFVHTPTPCMLHNYSCVLTDILYEFVYLVLRYTTRMALLKIE